ncbi:MAG: 50S ribosomal protein L29 [bacterium]|nr:50S ribosomal protein L29 [Coprothermobacterota bacterium]
MKTTKLRDFSPDELKNKLTDLKSELFNLRFQQSTGQLRNPLRIQIVRKDIARMMTVLREMELKKEGQA